jgi:hypothetical protein
MYSVYLHTACLFNTLIQAYKEIQAQAPSKIIKGQYCSMTDARQARAAPKKFNILYVMPFLDNLLKRFRK